MAILKCCCGEVELRVSAAPLTELYCHCADCRQATGGASAPIQMYFRRDVEVIEGEPRKWKVRKLDRWMCPSCGTRLFSEASPEVLSVHATLKGAPRFTPRLHINCESALAPVSDGLPHYARLPSAMGGDDERVDW